MQNANINIAACKHVVPSDIEFDHAALSVVVCSFIHLGNLDVTGGVHRVPARYVRHSQMCPQLDVSDKNDQKSRDMSDTARFVRQK